MVKSNPIVIFGKKYRSINNASVILNLSKTSLLKVARTAGYEGPTLDQAVKELLKNRTGSWQKTVTINGTIYKSFTAAAIHFGVTGGTISNWVDQKGNDFVLNVEELEFNKKVKGSRAHLNSLVERAKFTTKEDWYEKSRQTPDILNLQKWLDRGNINLLDFLDEYFKDEPLHWWLMQRVPQGTWTNPVRVSQYLNWLALKLGFSDPEDWYQVTAKEFKENRGGSLLTYYPTIIEIIQILHPNLIPWYFHTLPNSYWQDTDNHKGFLLFLAEVEKINSIEDWYRKANKNTFSKYKGLSLLKEYKNIYDCISTNLSEYDFKFWMFPSSRGNWELLENQREYINWLGGQLGVVNPTDWYNVTEQDFVDNYGITLLGQYYSSSVSDCIMTILKDQYAWEKIRFYRNEYKREVRLYGIISCGLPNYKVHFRYKHPKVRHPSSGRKVEYDIFIDKLGVAIEYQGEQHYRPVDRFDGNDPVQAKKSFQRRQRTDQEKREQSSEHNIVLLEIKYSDWNGSLDYILNLANNELALKITREIVIANALERGLVDDTIIYSDD